MSSFLLLLYYRGCWLKVWTLVDMIISYKLNNQIPQNPLLWKDASKVKEILLLLQKQVMKHKQVDGMPALEVRNNCQDHPSIDFPWSFKITVEWNMIWKKLTRRCTISDSRSPVSNLSLNMRLPTLRITTWFMAIIDKGSQSGKVQNYIVSVPPYEQMLPQDHQSPFFSWIGLFFPLHLPWDFHPKKEELKKCIWI